MSNAEKYLKKGTRVRPNSIVLVNPKHAHNVGMVLRMAACHCVGDVWCTGQRIWDAVEDLDRVPREERLRAYKDVNLFWHAGPLPPFEPECVPVAMEFRPQSEDLFEFEHPTNPVYIFGPEDGTLDGHVLSKCHRFVKIDTMECLNLATAAATVMYDMRLKAHMRTLSRALAGAVTA